MINNIILIKNCTELKKNETKFPELNSQQISVNNHLKSQAIEPMQPKVVCHQVERRAICGFPS